MYPYSHLVVASWVEALLCPANREEYYLGAVIPDVRYYCRLPRRRTHLPAERIAGLAARYPHLQSFALGYMFHCAADDLRLPQLALRRLPLGPLRGVLPGPAAQVLLEFYFMERAHVRQHLAEGSNEILAGLGITDADVGAFARELNRFLAAPSYTAGLALARNLGLLNHPRAARYLRIARQLGRRRPLRRFLLASIETSALERQATQCALSLPALER
jgi:hypothetical protein